MLYKQATVFVFSALLCCTHMQQLRLARLRSVRMSEGVLQEKVTKLVELLNLQPPELSKVRIFLLFSGVQCSLACRAV